MHRRILMTAFRPGSRGLLLLLTLAISLAGCASMTEDVDQYYRQMAANYKEAEEKTKVQIETQEREASMLLNGGEVHQFKRAMKKVSRLKDWQEHCVRERERFEQAAEKLEQPAAHGTPQAPAEATGK